ncbi:MAG: hypothetical protein R6U50_03635 [Desulfobacterales bacterium]
MHSESETHPKIRRISSIWKRFRAFEPAVLIIVIFIVAGIWIFIELADKMIEGETRVFDQKLIIAMRNPDDLSDPVGPKWSKKWEEMSRRWGGSGY